MRGLQVPLRCPDEERYSVSVIDNVVHVCYGSPRAHYGKARLRKRQVLISDWREQGCGTPVNGELDFTSTTLAL